MMEDDYDDAELADLEKALALLRGQTILGLKGLPSHQYFNEASEEYADGRRALARLLRGNKPLDSLIRSVLADLFDPSAPRGHLEFKRGSGPNPEESRQAKLAYEVIIRLRGDQKKVEPIKDYPVKVEPVVEDVAKAFGVSVKTVWNAWARYKEH